MCFRLFVKIQRGWGWAFFFVVGGWETFSVYNITSSDLYKQIFSLFSRRGGGIQAVLATYFPAAPAAPKGEMREHVSSSWGWKAVCL